MKKKKYNLNLFRTFFKIGLFTFGGGYAMLSLIEEEVVKKNKYLSKEEMSDIITIGESTPGPISVNVATFVGYKVNGIIGALSATLGLICPSFFIILFLASILQKLQESTIFQNAFLGIRACVVALIIKALINMYKECPKNILSYILIVFSLIAVTFFDIGAILIIIISGIVGMLSFYLKDRRHVK